ncbi:HD-GYP domain-containing protein [Pseudoalteromonas sp. SS15]|uniref:HD-GYP domain-containing protein n=1 Tax=Pseudoalteromonas sp. SS15 TaxID=3139393 RepID=UPI003BA93774
MMPLQKINSSQLQMGMTVVKLDKNWLETPFLKHKFTIETEKQLLQLRATCKFVYINANQSSSINTKEPLNINNPLKAKRTLHSSLNLLNTALKEFKESEYLSSKKIQQIVNSLIIQVLNDSKTYKYLDEIRSNSPLIAQKSLRVLVLYLTFCKYLGIKKSQLLELGCAALLHDIGMTKLSVNFNRPKMLSQTEKRGIEIHTQIGVQIIEKNRNFSPLVGQIIKSHHENFDGTGYPDGLSKRQINLYSRMLTLICTYEALTRNRGYKAALSSYSAVTELFKISGSMLDPRLVAKFIEIVKEYPVGVRAKTQRDEEIQIISRIKKNKYKAVFLNALEPKQETILDSNHIKSVIYE